ncbi:MAG: ImmA/IrrE family metallo-endopeptidase [Planctomycetes bacterium]|nr:ImmA/IrrE family metallo-endopeptidase [Planctomycetota bacterium]
MDGFTSSDLKNIFVDEFIYKSRPGRYRFTLAHEAGHVILHNDVYKKANFQNTQEWKEFINSIPYQAHRWLEYQAYSFGGLVLVPSEHLQRLADKHVKRIRKEGLSLEENWDFGWECIKAQLAKDFEVSTQSIERRLEKDEIKERYQTNKNARR